MTDTPNKMAIVTGGTSGIGLAVARRLLDAGVSVAILSEQPQAEIDRICDELGAGASGYRCDVRFRDQTAAVVDAVAGTTGSIDILVNSAGLSTLDAVCSTDEDATRLMVDVNFHGAYNMILAALPHMKARRHGHIVNIASAAAALGPSGQAVYAATKAALVMLTEALPQQLKNCGIRINAIGPGAVRTPMTALIHTPTSDPARAIRDHIGRLVPSPDPGGEYILEPDHIANIVLWLCSTASWGVNGTFILADHGLSTSWSGLPPEFEGIG